MSSKKSPNSSARLSIHHQSSISPVVNPSVHPSIRLLFSASALKPSVRVSQQQQPKPGAVMLILRRPQPTLPAFYAPQAWKKQNSKTLSFRKSSRTGVHSTCHQAGTDIRPQRAGWRLHNLSARCASPSQLQCHAGRPAGPSAG